MTAATDFIAWLQPQAAARVLELGTKRSNPDMSTAHRTWAYPNAKFIMSDFADGLDVDVLADVHHLSDVFGVGQFDAVIAASVFEHVQRPWVAAKEIAKVLRPGGQVFVQTHFAFRIHGYPNDYWRFTTDALITIFEDAGCETILADYEFPCQIESARIPTINQGIAYLNANIASRVPQIQPS